ncbi:hypothetical protein [Leptospira interrogans]|uniref:Uncharacterized protein n=1 Tax=Leptospira interrogans serovar Icterohaemorrhagiae TaxID=90062 RepID=A0AAW4K3B1_LEPIR|nr:hypothetical protein [Leptospira interrogans]MBO7994203.1 hypothetical protein [Leptospira interrogans serovar Copenhageni]MBO7998070.1 hypothetical protein [Leptospira interrogans serovar Copenhageni]MBO8001377.1 hypothetical protein [Leptospira interrogans serovar Copenhageni]MBO8010506.1 hypothetical protein [Leptospira interrogans serovar Copenhageni]MBO8016096.1 hypothetical protein [Leptospira interrogans serovar Icterohaemorrhagiae]
MGRCLGFGTALSWELSKHLPELNVSSMVALQVGGNSANTSLWVGV